MPIDIDCEQAITSAVCDDSLQLVRAGDEWKILTVLWAEA